MNDEAVVGGGAADQSQPGTLGRFRDLLLVPFSFSLSLGHALTLAMAAEGGLMAVMSYTEAKEKCHSAGF